MTRQAYAEIDLSAIQSNIQTLKHCASTAQLMAVVKANAYGLGLSTIAPALFDADALAVRAWPEAITLREQGLKQPIVLLEGPFAFEELQYCAQNHIVLVLHTPTQVQWVIQSRLQLTVWLKVDLGMRRLGFEPHDIPAYYRQLNDLPSVTCLGVLGHCPTADEPEDDRTVLMGERIKQLSQQLKCDYSLANSAVTLRYPQYHGQWVRCGLSLYGFSPLENNNCDLNLKPAVTLNSQIMHIRELPPYQRVGYGGQWTTPASGARIGIVSMGYGDGYPQGMPSGSPVWIAGQTVKTVGRVNMDMILVDLSQHPEIRVGEKVLLWGGALPIDIVAKAAGSSPYELLTRLPAALPRRVC